MNHSLDGPAPPVVPLSWRPIVIGLLLLAAGGPEALRASPLRNRQPLVWDQAADRAEAYFARALRDQRQNVEIPVGERLLRSSDGLLPETAFVRYLRWRRGLRTAQFDRWHPLVAAMMIRDEQIRASTLLPTIVPRVDRPTVPPRRPTEQAVPEPSALLVALVLGGSVALGRRRALAADPRDGDPTA
ncbi:MAG TPA: hypothetical protein VF590_03155 [Isosphaeraceae bacterium]|jgi:hypothetical protein